jgi:hypothetical protein
MALRYPSASKVSSIEAEAWLPLARAVKVAGDFILAPIPPDREPSH